MKECDGRFHNLTLPCVGRSPSPARCKCGAYINLPDDSPAKAILLSNEPEMLIGGVSRNRAFEIQNELYGKIWE